MVADPPLSLLSLALADLWALERSTTGVTHPAYRLVWPHLVLLGATGQDLSRTAQVLSACVLQPAFQFTDRRRLAPAHQARDAAAQATPDPVAIVARYTRAYQDLAWTLQEADAIPADLLGAWDEVAHAYEPGEDLSPEGRDAAGLPWMPALGSLSPQLPLIDGYRRLGETPLQLPAAGPRGGWYAPGALAQLLLLALAGEAGVRSLVLHWGVLAAETGHPVAEVQAAVARLGETGWIVRDRWDDHDGDAPRVMHIAPDRRALVFRGIGAR